MVDKPEPWMVAAAELAEEARQAGDMKQYHKIMDKAEARIDREVAEERKQKRR